MKIVMIVEDDDAVLDVLKTMLSDKFRIIEAKNGKEAIQKFRMLKPDIILMDIAMPEMDGIEATRQIKKLDPDAKIIGVSAFAKHRGKEILEAGALDVIEKPFSRSVLIQKIEKFLS